MAPCSTTDQPIVDVLTDRREQTIILSLARIVQIGAEHGIHFVQE